MRQRARPAVFPVFVLVLGAALAASAQVAPARTVKIKVTAEQANLREKPDIGSGIVQQVPEGTVLEADRKEGEWFFVRYALEDGGVIGGWIHESLVEVAEGVVAPVEAKPADKPAERTAPPRERRRARTGLGRIEKPEFRTGAFPLEAAFSAGAAAFAPRDLNDGARGYAGAFGAQIGIQPPIAPGAVRAGLLTGIELNYRFSPKLAVGLAADYMKGSNRSRIEYVGDVTTATVETRPAARAVPVKVVARYYPARGVYVRGGLGVYAVKVSYLYRAGWPELQEQWRGTATASGFGGEAAFGGEWEPAARTALFIEAGFRYARFTRLTGKDVYTNAVGSVTTIGTLDRWDEQPPGGNAYPRLFVMAELPVEAGITGARAAVVNLSGGAVRAGVRYRF